MIAALNIKIDIGVVIAHIDFIDQIVYQSLPLSSAIGSKADRNLSSVIDAMFFVYLRASIPHAKRKRTSAFK